LLPAALAALALGVLPLPGSAQVVRGTVIDEASSRGLPGVVVVLLDSAGKRVAGVLADDEGRYAIRITAPGRYAVRAERIGYRADAATPVSLAVGETVELRLVTRPVPVELAAVRVTGRSPCVAGAADGREVSAVWEETRKALYATDLTQRQELFSARTTRYERQLDVRNGRVLSHKATETTLVTRNPFISWPAAQLSALGYVRQEGREVIYSAPDAGVLMSDEFLRDHCFRLRNGEGKRGGLIGLSFQPVRGREIPDIAGTLWVDRNTAELRDLEYVYTQLPNLPSDVRIEQFGGHVEFRRMPTGAWIVERWVIRMPVLVDRGQFGREPMVVPGTAPSRTDRVQLAAIGEEGGQVVETMARGVRGGLSTEVASVSGTVFDSTRMLPLAGARVFLDGTQFSAQSGADGTFTINDVPPGSYALSEIHPRFDSLNLRAPSDTVTLRANEQSRSQLAGPSAATIFARDCTAAERQTGPAALRGHVRDGFSSGPAVNAEVTLAWKSLVKIGNSVGGVREPSVTTRTDSAGRYDFCGLPERVAITARVTADDRRSAPVQFTLSEGEISVRDFVVGQPTIVASAPNESAVADAPVAPSAGSNAPKNSTMREFERRRRRGGGGYLTRAQIDRLHASRLTDLLRSLPGVSVEPNENGALVVELRRSKSFTIDPSMATRGDSASRSSSAPNTSPVKVRKCPAAFQVDGLPIDGGASADIEVHPETIEAIEVYSGGQVPIELGSRYSECGVVIIWTRAFAGRSDGSAGRL
jgi:hypothetical protein